MAADWSDIEVNAAASAISSLIGIGGKALADLLANRITPQQAVDGMVEAVGKMGAEATDLDAVLKAQRAEFDKRMDAVDALRAHKDAEVALKSQA